MNQNNFRRIFTFTVNEVPIIGFVLAIVFLGLSLITQKRNGWSRTGMLTLGIFVGGYCWPFSAAILLLM